MSAHPTQPFKASKNAGGWNHPINACTFGAWQAGCRDASLLSSAANSAKAVQQIDRVGRFPARDLTSNLYAFPNLAIGKEFQLSQSSMDLSTELTSSGAVNVVTRTGTNDWHGEGFYFFREDRVAASLPTPPGLKAPFQRHQYGGRVGGPVLKDMLFFFLDGEKTLQHLQAPVAEPVPFTPFSGTFPAPFKDGETLARLDYQLSRNVRLFYRNSYFQNSTFATFFPSSFQVYNNKDISRQNVVGADFTSGSFTHSVRFSYLKFQNQIVDAARGSGLPLADFPVIINIDRYQRVPTSWRPRVPHRPTPR